MTGEVTVLTQRRPDTIARRRKAARRLTDRLIHSWTNVTFCQHASLSRHTPSRPSAVFLSLSVSLSHSSVCHSLSQSVTVCLSHQSVSVISMSPSSVCQSVSVLSLSVCLSPQSVSVSPSGSVSVSVCRSPQSVSPSQSVSLSHSSVCLRMSVCRSVSSLQSSVCLSPQFVSLS